MRESVDNLAMLKAGLALIAGDECSSRGRIATGHEALDAELGGGLARGRLHELFASETDDGPNAAGFAAMLALLAAGRESPVLWLRTDEAERINGRLHAPGLVELGCDPGLLLLGQAPDIRALLRSAADAARCSGLKALVVECPGKCPMLDLTASRRLALAAEQSGVTLFLLRLNAEPVPSAADTRWAVGSAPSKTLEANAPGPPMFEIELLRRRAGPAGMRWMLEWNRDRLIFREPALPGAMVSLSSSQSVSANDSSLRLSA